MQRSVNESFLLFFLAYGLLTHYLLYCMKMWPLKPHSDSLDEIFTSTKLKTLASFQDLYVGLEPYRNDGELFGGVIKKTAPTVFGLLSALELHPTNKLAGGENNIFMFRLMQKHILTLSKVNAMSRCYMLFFISVFAPKGGFQSVSKAFKSLAESRGVKFQYNCTVTKICSNGVYYKKLNDQSGTTMWMPADLCVVNADLPYATKSLFEHEKKDVIYDWDDSFDFSSGVIAFHWCVNKRLDALNTHNVFLFSDNCTLAKQSWSVLRKTANYREGKNENFCEPFNFYVHRPCNSDPSAAPDGHDSVTILVPCQTLKRSTEVARLGKEEAMKVYRKQFDEKFINSIRDAVFTRLSILKGVGDLKKSVLHEYVDTPATYANLYNLGAGTPFGLVSC